MKTSCAAAFAVLFSFLANSPCMAQKRDRNVSQELSDVALSNSPFPWPRDASQAARITKQQIIDLLLAIDKAAAVADGEAITGLVEDVESHMFVSLDDGPPYLVAVADSSPMKWFQYIAIIRCNGMICTSKWVHSEPPNDLNKQILDLNKDGKHQLLVKRCVCPNGERQAGALLYIYGESNGQISDESATYPDFFRMTVLPDLRSKVRENAPDELNSQDEIEKRRAELLYEQHDVERRVLGERIAGLADAQRWEQSKSEEINTLAIMTYEQIDSPEAEAGLRRMSQSASPLIRGRVQDALGRKVLKTAQ